MKETTGIFRATRLTSSFGSQETEGWVKSVRPTALTGWRTEDSAVPSYRQDLEGWGQLNRRKATFQAAEAKVLLAVARVPHTTAALRRHTLRCGAEKTEANRKFWNCDWEERSPSTAIVTKERIRFAAFEGTRARETSRLKGQAAATLEFGGEDAGPHESMARSR